MPKNGATGEGAERGGRQQDEIEKPGKYKNPMFFNRLCQMLQM
jgi:hypothetical protein